MKIFDATSADAIDEHPAAQWDALRKDYAFVYFGNDWTAENRTSSHHIAARLSSKYPLLYVETPGTRAPKASKRDLTKIFAKIAKMFKPPEQVSANMTRMTVAQIPLTAYSAVRKLNKIIAIFLIRRTIAKLGYKKWILWFALPGPGYVLGQLNESHSVYYCIDNYTALPGVDKKLVAELDASLTERAGSLFVAPPSVFEQKKAANKHVYFSPHGVDFDLFSQGSQAGTQTMPQMDQVTGPVVGYWGLVAEWTDVTLLADLAKARPNITVVLIGHASVDVTELSGLKNVMMVGPQPYKTLGRWAKSFDACLIPYKLNNLMTMNGNPLKLREYLAAGKPVVSISVPEIERFKDYVYIARSTQEFIAHVDAAILDKAPEAIERRMQLFANASWESRVNETVDIVFKNIAGEK
jgi:glycosyltransferase involved in cell wall biosynthesis